MADRRIAAQGGRFSRRALLAGGGATAALIACSGRGGQRDAAPPRGTSADTSATTTPTSAATATPDAAAASDQAAVDADRVLADGEHFPDGFVVPAGETWALANGAHVTSAGNVVVQGALVMHEPDPARTMRLTFVDVDEAAFVGGDTHEVVDTDVGLWVVEEGVLDVQGAAKSSWTRLTEPASRGARQIVVEDATGWRVGDSLAITPTVGRSVDGYHEQSDRVVVTAVNGNRIGLDAALAHEHPTVDGRWNAEVINLTRSVVIEGTPDHKAHVVFLHQGMHASRSYRAGTIRHLELAHLGPNQPNDRDEPSSVVGRYALHWHHGAHTTDGVVVDGVVAHDCGAHAFVPHSSDGITFRNCASHATRGDAYWWDPGDASNYVIYDRCIASDVSVDGQDRYSTNGFFAAHSTKALSCVIRNCVAVGVHGPDSAGFFWDNGPIGVWAFEDCLAHNIEHNGIRVWQNSSPVHPVDRFTAYGCSTGISHGAYSNAFQYHGATIHDCGTGIDVSAVSADEGGGLEFHDVVASACDSDLSLTDGPVDSARPTDFRRCRFAGVSVSSTHTESQKRWDFIDCGLTPEDFRVEELAGVVDVRTQVDGQAWRLTNEADWAQTAAI